MVTPRLAARASELIIVGLLDGCGSGLRRQSDLRFVPGPRFDVGGGASRSLDPLGAHHPADLGDGDAVASGELVEAAVLERIVGHVAKSGSASPHMPRHPGRGAAPASPSREPGGLQSQPGRMEIRARPLRIRGRRLVREGSHSPALLGRAWLPI
jgi:hypothetical protein